MDASFMDDVLKTVKAAFIGLLVIAILAVIVAIVFAVLYFTK